MFTSSLSLIIRLRMVTERKNQFQLYKQEKLEWIKIKTLSYLELFLREDLSLNHFKTRQKEIL